MQTLFGAEFRRVEDREYLGKTAVVVVASRTYDTTADDLWEAITTPARLARWFTPVEGNLELGGRYQLKGNAGGTITQCKAPHALDVTWEFGGGTSWVTVRLTAEGKRTKLTLEHIAHKEGIGEEHLKKYGPGAVGIGWDLSFEGLAMYLPKPEVALDHTAVEAHFQTAEGKALIRGSGEAWEAAHVAAGQPAEEAHAQAERTIAFYTGG